MVFGIGELARKSACGIETIRYYERSGLIPRAVRRGRNRCYGHEDVVRLRFIRTARTLGFSTADITLLLRVQSGDQPCSAAQRVAVEQLRLLDEHMAEMAAMRDWLVAEVAHCADPEAEECPLVHAMEHASLR